MLAAPTRASRDSRLAASTAAREVMRSATAVRQRRASWKSAQAAANVLVRELYGLLNGQDSRRLFADHGNRLSQENGRRFGWSEAGWWAWEDLNLRLHPYQACSRDAFLLVRRGRPA